MSIFSEIIVEGRKYIFGKYPDENACKFLREEKGVRIFLSLVEGFEIHELGDYITFDIFRPRKDCTFLHFPIVEKQIPLENERVLSLLQYINDKNKYPIYIHCKNGRGRTGLIMSLILIHNHQFSIEKAFMAIYRAHRKGHGLNPVWKGRILPPHKNQRIYVKNFYFKMSKEKKDAVSVLEEDLAESVQQVSFPIQIPIFSTTFSLVNSNHSLLEPLID